MAQSSSSPQLANILASTSLANMIAEHWVDKALTALYPNLMAYEHLVKPQGPEAAREIPVRKGQIIHWHREPILAAVTTPLTESGDDPAPQSVTVSAVTATVQQYGAYCVISDIAEDVGLDAATNVVARALAYQCLRSFDTLLISTVTAASAGNLKLCNGKSAGQLLATDVLKRAELSSLQYQFARSNIRPMPGTGRYHYLAHPATMKDLKSATGSTDIMELLKYTDPSKLNGLTRVLNDIEGFLIAETTEVPSTTASGIISGGGANAKAYLNLAAGYESIGCVSLGGAHVGSPPREGTGDLTDKPHYKPNIALRIQGLGSGGTADPLGRRASVAWKMMFSAVLLDTNPYRAFIHACGSGNV